MTSIILGLFFVIISSVFYVIIEKKQNKKHVKRKLNAYIESSNVSMLYCIDDYLCTPFFKESELILLLEMGLISVVNNKLELTAEHRKETIADNLN